MIWCGCPEGESAKVWSACDIFRCRQSVRGYKSGGTIIGVIRLVLLTYLGVSWRTRVSKVSILKMDTGHALLAHPLEICASVWLWLFSVNKYCRETCLIPAQIICRFPVIQLGIGEIECWNIYQSTAYSAEGPLCMLMWSFTTRSEVKYLSHLNKKASAASHRVGECAPECMTRDKGSKFCVIGVVGVASQKVGAYWACQDEDMSLTSLSALSQTGISPGLSALQQTEHGVWVDAAGCSCAHEQMAPNL